MKSLSVFGQYALAIRTKVRELYAGFFSKIEEVEQRVVELEAQAARIPQVLKTGTRVEERLVRGDNLVDRHYQATEIIDSWWAGSDKATALRKRAKKLREAMIKAREILHRETDVDYSQHTNMKGGVSYGAASVSINCYKPYPRPDEAWESLGFKAEAKSRIERIREQLETIFKEVKEVEE